jgi:hypothetical protein
MCAWTEIDPVSLGRLGAAGLGGTELGADVDFSMIFYLPVLSVTQKPCGFCVSFLQCYTVTGSTVAWLIPSKSTAL